MTPEHLRHVIEEHIRVENDGDLEATLDTCAATCVFTSVPRQRAFHGRSGARDMYAATFAAFPDWHVEMLNFTPGEDHAWAECEATATHLGTYEGIPATGRRVRFRLAVKFLVHGDKLGGEVLYFDRATILEQITDGHSGSR
ncbi:MAG TPA: ester cyclase [Chloroflexota bacterium]